VLQTRTPKKAALKLYRFDHCGSSHIQGPLSPWATDTDARIAIG
jgi:hypothetical protein